MTMTDHIRVRGTAFRRVSPDVAVWVAVVDGRATSEREAFGACSARLTAMHQTLSDIAQTAEVSTDPVHVWAEWNEAGRRRTGYAAQGAVRIRGPIDEAGRLGQAALDAGATRLDGPRYLVGDIVSIEDELAAEAVMAARRRAQHMADAADRRLGHVVSIADEGTESMQSGGGFEIHTSAMRTMADEVSAPPMAPPMQEIETTVVVTFPLM